MLGVNRTTLSRRHRGVQRSCCRPSAVGNLVTNSAVRGPLYKLSYDATNSTTHILSPNFHLQYPHPNVRQIPMRPSTTPACTQPLIRGQVSRLRRKMHKGSFATYLRCYEVSRQRGCAIRGFRKLNYPHLLSDSFGAVATASFGQHYMFLQLRVT